MTTKARAEFELFKTEDALRAARAVEVELTNANARLVAELDAERQAHTEAERAVAALEVAARDAWTAAGRVVQELQHHRNNGKTPPALAAKIDDLERATPSEVLSSPIGSGWLSPAEAAAAVAAEREACANVAEREPVASPDGHIVRWRIADHIRARTVRAPAAAHPTETP